MSNKFLSSRRLILILLLLLVGAPFLLLNHQVRNRMKRKKLESDAGMIGYALRDYRRDNDNALPRSFSDLTFGGVNIVDFRHYYDGGRGDEIASDSARLPDKKIDLEFFTLCPPGTRIGKSGKDVFAVGKLKGLDLLNVIYVDGSVEFDVKP
jgi:type II secretory pathway pseudopilin PulG